MFSTFKFYYHSIRPFHAMTSVQILRNTINPCYWQCLTNTFLQNIFMTFCRNSCLSSTILRINNSITFQLNDLGESMRVEAFNCCNSEQTLSYFDVNSLNLSDKSLSFASAVDKSWFYISQFLNKLFFTHIFILTLS